MSVHLLEEFYVPADSELKRVLQSGPAAREIYQLTLKTFLDDIGNIITKIDDPIEVNDDENPPTHLDLSMSALGVLQTKFNELELLIQQNDREGAAAKAKEFYEAFGFIKTKLEKVLDSLSASSIPSFSDKSIDESDLRILMKYLNTFKARMEDMATHRLKTPLTIVGTGSYVIDKVFDTTEDPLNDKRVAERLHSTKNALNEYTEIFAEIEEFYNVCFSFDRFDQEIEMLNVDGISNVFFETLAQPEFSEINVDFDFDSISNTIRIDRVQLARAIRQIFINCIDFKKVGEEPKVLISIKMEGNRLKIYIHDNGIGISDNEQKLIFEPFYTKDMVGLNFENLVGTGFGLGLPIAKGLIERYGEISIQSVQGEGTTVVLDFLAR